MVLLVLIPVTIDFSIFDSIQWTWSTPVDKSVFSNIACRILQSHWREKNVLFHEISKARQECMFQGKGQWSIAFKKNTTSFRPICDLLVLAHDTWSWLIRFIGVEWAEWLHRVESNRLEFWIESNESRLHKRVCYARRPDTRSAHAKLGADRQTNRIGRANRERRRVVYQLRNFPHNAPPTSSCAKHQRQEFIL